MADDRKPKEQQGLPEGWKWVRLEEVANLVKDISPAGSKPYLEIGDIDILSKNYTIKEKESPNHCIKAKRGNIVISKVRPTRGAISLIKENFLYVSPAFSVLEADNSKFLFYSLSRQQFFNYLGALETGTTYPSVNDKDVMNYELPLPPLPEQRKIAEILETVDNAIEKTEKIIEKYKRIKQGLMQDLLTKGIDEKGNIRSEKTHKFKDSPLGRIPEEWEVVRLEEISNKIIDGTHYTPQYTDDGIPFLRIVDLQSQSINLDSVIRISPQEHKILSKRCLPEYGDILLSKNGTVGISKVVNWTWEFSIFVSICLIKPKHEKVVNIFLKYFLDSEWIKKQILKRTKQLSVINLHLEEIRDFLIFLPPLSEQKRIAEILSQIDQAIEKEEKYKEKLERLKKGLMEDLLTGKVRVNKLLEGENYETA
ncbi:MAG: restriction endonuclease subunit S [Thermocrinis sp.]|jgi:type I restriction enzyme S subunit|uniref:restriction endonuclease subunit S n=1 Tax=Thermocrinis sp. TaxID=2024383 RepID=UPI003C072CFF